MLNDFFEAFGFYEFGIVNTAEIRFRQDIRAMCEVNTCRAYGTTWACPPAVGTVEECRDRVQKYEKMVVLSGKYDLEDSFDYESIQEGMQKFRVASRSLNQALRERFSDYFMLSNEGCDLCSKCTYPMLPAGSRTGQWVLWKATVFLFLNLPPKRA